MVRPDFSLALLFCVNTPLPSSYESVAAILPTHTSHSACTHDNPNPVVALGKTANDSKELSQTHTALSVPVTGPSLLRLKPLIVSFLLDPFSSGHTALSRGPLGLPAHVSCVTLLLLIVKAHAL